MFRSAILALLCSLLVVRRFDLSCDPTEPLGPFLLTLVPLGFVGGLAVKGSGVEACRSWRRFWNLLIAGLWLGATGWALEHELASIQGQGWPLVASWWTTMQPYAMTTSVFFGYLWLLDHYQRAPSRVGQVLALAGPLALLPLLLLHPAGGSLMALPWIAWAGILPSPSDMEPQLEDARASALVALLEMLSSQTIAWGLWLASFGMLRELARGSYLEALFVAFSFGLPAWLGGGVIWGLSDALRRGKGEPWRSRLLRLLFGE